MIWEVEDQEDSELLKSRISRRENGRGQRALMALFKIYSIALRIEKKMTSEQ